MLSDVLEFTSNATKIMICIGHFQSNLRMSFLCVPINGALAVEYWMGVLALTDKYSTDNIARQRDMRDCAAILEWRRL